MTGEELAFWTMMGFSCLIGIFIGYLLFSPRRGREAADTTSEMDDVDGFYDTDTDPDTASGLSAQNGAPGAAGPTQREPWLADRETLREKARERAMTRMAESEKRIRQEQQAAASASNAASGTAEPKVPAAADQPFIDPQTIKAWDDMPPPSRRRRPGTWVKAEPADE